jgi:hypothetical protein
VHSIRCYRIFQYRMFRFNHFCWMASPRQRRCGLKLSTTRSPAHVWPLPGDGRMSRNKDWPLGLESLRASCPNMNVASAASMWSNCWLYRGRSASILSNSLLRSRGQPGAPTGSAADYPLRTKPTNVHSKSQPKNAVSRRSCMKLVLEPRDEDFDTPDQTRPP